MSFRKFDAGAGHRLTKDNGDCQVRALATATGRTYRESWELLYAIQGERRETGFSLIALLKENDPRLGVIRALPFPAVRGQARMNGRRFCAAHPKGNFILNMAGHDVAVEDGVIFDRWDCSEKCVYSAYEVAVVTTRREGPSADVSSLGAST
jgi:hypothetical protein